MDVVVIGAGPAGVIAALRAARLGARTTLVTRDDFGGMAANDGPVPVRTLAQAARLIREARQFSLYGIEASSVSLDYRRLLDRVHDVTGQARTRSLMRDDLGRAGVVILRASRTGAVHRRAHHRKRRRSAPSGGQGHHLYWRNGATARRPRVRAHRNAQRRVGAHLGAAIVAGARSRRHGSAGSLDLQRVRLTRPTRRGWLRAS